MDDQKTDNGAQGLVQVWINVADADGSTRLESRWTSAEQAAAIHATYAA